MNESSLIGARLGDFQILRRLGRGGMAEVYAARQLSLRREVAVKVLRPEFARDPDYVRRFQREARSVAKLNHPNIVSVLDVGTVDEITYMVQELVDGENLRETMLDQGAIAADEVREVLVSVGAALVEAESAGIVHRDIKPENLIRASNGTLKVADFGLARVTVGSESSMASMTQVGMTLGTPRYMSPEQIQGKEVDCRSDLYSLGVTAYHLLTGKAPFDADDPVALAVMHLHETPQPIERARQSTTGKQQTLDDNLLAVIGRLMAKSPADRFQSPAELVMAVTENVDLSTPSATLAGHRAGVAARLQRATTLAARHRRRRQMMVGAGTLAALATFAIAFLLTSRSQADSSLVETLRVDRVIPQPTVEEQYLVAMQRNDVAGWRAVETYFPADANAVQADYVAKSRLQCARLLSESDRTREALETLALVIQDPQVDRVYRTLASAFELLIAKRSDKAFDSAARIQQLQADVNQLKANSPKDAALFRRLAPQSIVTLLEIGDSGQR